MHSTFLILTVLQGFISQFIGIYAIFKGTYKPQRMTRFIYLLMSALFIATLIAQGSTDALFLAVMNGLGTLCIFLLSFKYGVGGTNKLDIVTFFGFLISLIAWKLTSNPTVGLYLSILTDLIGFIPTIEKTWRQPHTEDWRFYFSDILAGGFSTLSVRSYSLANLAFPLYIFFLNGFAVMLILIRGKAVRTTTPND